MPSCSCSTTTTNELQQQREEEVGHREAEVRERRGRVVEHRVLPHRAHHADEQRRASPTAPPRCRRAGASSRWLRPPCRRPAARCGTTRPSRPARSRRASRTYCCGTRLVEVVLVLEVARSSAARPPACAGVGAADHRAPRRAANTTIVAQDDDRNRDQQPPHDERDHRTRVLAEERVAARPRQPAPRADALLRPRSSDPVLDVPGEAVLRSGCPDTPVMVSRYPSWVGFWNSGITVTSFVASCWSTWL